MSNRLKSALKSGQEARIVQIDFNPAFDRVNHQGILYKLCFVGIGGPVFKCVVCNDTASINSITARYCAVLTLC